MTALRWDCTYNTTGSGNYTPNTKMMNTLFYYKYVLQSYWQRSDRLQGVVSKGWIQNLSLFPASWGARQTDSLVKTKFRQHAWHHDCYCLPKYEVELTDLKRRVICWPLVWDVHFVHVWELTMASCQWAVWPCHHY